VQLGLDKPVAQFPFIDPARCIVCSACVAACPEGDVLGVVGGTATVVNGLRCVGHGRCAEACPVGAIEVGLGDLKSRADVPVTDDAHESDVPGLFVVGELGGLALVRNAVAQGRRAVERAAARLARERGAAAADVLDLIIVGAGPAGLSATAAAHQRGLSYVTLEQERDLGGTVFHYPRRKLVLVEPLELPLWGCLTREEYAKEELLAVLQELVERFRLDLRFGQRVTSVTREAGVFTVRTGGGAAFRSRTLVLALGRRGTPRKLGVPGEELPKVMYQLVNAESYQGRRVLVVGGGDSAVEAAIGLARQKGNAVTLSYRRERARAQEERRPLRRARGERARAPAVRLARRGDHARERAARVGRRDARAAQRRRVRVRRRRAALRAAAPRGRALRRRAREAARRGVAAATEHTGIAERAGRVHSLRSPACPLWCRPPALRHVCCEGREGRAPGGAVALDGGRVAQLRRVDDDGRAAVGFRVEAHFHRDAVAGVA
jgi:thioredoxin reductase